MTEPTIRDFHAHIYFDAAEVERARALASGGAGAVRRRGRPFPSAARSARIRADACR